MLVSSISPSTTRFFGNYPANINVLLAFCWQKGERFTLSKLPLAVHQSCSAKYATSKHIQTPCQVNHWVTPKTTRSKGAVVVSILPEVELTSLASVGPPATLGPLDELRMWGFSNLRWGGLASQPYHGKILGVVDIHRHVATFCRPWTFISTCVVVFFLVLTFRKQTHMSGLIDVNTGLAWVDTTFRCSSSGLCDVFVSSNHFVATPYPHPKKNTEIQDQTGHKHMRNRAQRCPKPSFGKPLKNHSGLMVFLAYKCHSIKMNEYTNCYEPIKNKKPLVTNSKPLMLSRNRFAAPGLTTPPGSWHLPFWKTDPSRP